MNIMMRSVSLLLCILLLFFERSTAFSGVQSTSGSAAIPWGVSRPKDARSQADSQHDKRSTAFLIPNQFHKTALPFQQRRASVAPLRATSSKEVDEDAIKIIIAGAPASGKGTQCEFIKEKFGVVHLSTGDMLREAVAAGTQVGKQAKEFMDSGKLVPDDIIIGVVKDRLEEEDCRTKGWLLDGFPRTQAQAKALADAGISADCFIFLNVPDEILVERVVGRRTDPETGKIYHMTFSPPDDEEIRARLIQRSDDTEEKVKVRLEHFHSNVDAVKDSYTDISVTIDGKEKPSAVSKAIFEAIGSQIAA